MLFSSKSATTTQGEDRSEAVREILGTPPNTLMKYGNIAMLVALVAALWGAYITKYPDVVETKLTLTTVEPARRLKAPAKLVIDRILVAQEDSVAEGTILMVFQSSTKFEHVQYLHNLLLDKGPFPEDSVLAELAIPNSLILGDLQEDLFQFTEKREAYLVARDRRISGLSDREINRRIVQFEASLSSEKSIRDQLIQEVSVSARNLIRQQNLLDNRLLEQAEFDQVANEDLKLRRLLAASESRIRDISNNITLLVNQKDKFRSGEENDLQAASRDMRESYKLLNRSVEEWRQNNLLIAPKAGIVLVNIDVREQQRFNEEDELATLLPINPQGVLGRIDLPLQGSGKVAIGQRVIIKFLNFPSEEFGAVEGVVSSKSPIPSGEVIPIMVDLPNGMVTNTGNRLDPVQFMRAEAEIIVGEKRLLAWLFDRI